MSKRLIPNGDSDFDAKLDVFARKISADWAEFGVSEVDALEMVEAARRFREKFRKAEAARSQAATREKDEARAAAAKIYKRCVDLVHLCKEIDDAKLILFGLQPRSGKRRSRICPQEPPFLEFRQALHGASGALPMHELKFSSVDYSSTKPPGATRLELFVDLIAPDEPVPYFPGANDGGRPWYLRSFSRSPIRVAPPICRVPMLVLYWGRWADAIGNVGPFSQTVVSRIEGWSRHVMMHDPKSRRPEQVRALEDLSQGAAGARKYSVEVLDAQFRALHAQALQAPQRETRQLEGPATEAEAA